MVTNDKGVILIPSSSEEYSNYQIINFDKQDFLTQADLSFEQFGCGNFDKIAFSNGKYSVYQSDKLCKTKTTNLKKLKSQAQIMTEYDESTKSPSKLNSKTAKNSTGWNGNYEYSTYRENPNTGTGIGADYKIIIADKGCHIDIVGYQVDSHFECTFKPSSNTNEIEIFEKSNNQKFGVIRKGKNNKYSLRLNYYDGVEKPNSNFYEIEKKS